MVERTLGKGEVGSSILPRGTRKNLTKSKTYRAKPTFNKVSDNPNTVQKREQKRNNRTSNARNWHKVGTQRSSDVLKCESAAPLAGGHGARAIHKAKQKAPSLYTLMKQAQSIANEMPVTDLSVELMDALHVIIETLDKLEGDPDFEFDDEREIDADFEPSLGSQNPQITNNFFQPKGRIYTGGFLIPSSESQEGWAFGCGDDLEYDPAELGEEEERGFANPDDACSDVFAKGGRNV